MAVTYKLLKTNDALPNNAELRVVTTSKETAELQDMQLHIQQATSLTPSDVVGAITALQEEMAEQLKAGNSVHLPGIGYFSLAVAGDLYEDPRSHRVRLRNARVRTVKFRPDKGMMGSLQNACFENATYQRDDFNLPDMPEVEAALSSLFAERSVITVSNLQSALGLSKSYAYRLVNRLETAGKLSNIGSPYRKLYVRG